MELRKKTINIRGRDIELRELSILGQLELAREDNWINRIRQSVDEEDFVYLENLPKDQGEVKDALLLIETFNEVNGYNKPDVQDFPVQDQERSTEESK